MPVPHLLGIFTDIYGSYDSMTVPRALMISLIGFFTVLIVLGIIALFIKLIAVIFDLVESRRETEPVRPGESATPLPENESRGALVLTDTDEETAAMIMAIVSYKSGIPLNRLIFKSVKLLEDNRE
ncbi:MAG: OadG family protein [Clostridia bacterium]|nr:OadG family protein [Clostridia bacterium]